MTAPTHSLLIIERILRDREGLWRQILTERRLGDLIGQMLTCSAVALACYGAVLGASGGVLQALSSAIKLPILFLVTLVICLPTLYLFNLVFGARLSMRQAIALVLVAVTVTGVLSLAFAPVSLFFFITAPNYEFYKLLNVAILMLTGIVGLTMLMDGMRSLNRYGAEAGPAETPDAGAVESGPGASPAVEPGAAAQVTADADAKPALPAGEGGRELVAAHVPAGQTSNGPAPNGATAAPAPAAAGAPGAGQPHAAPYPVQPYPGNPLQHPGHGYPGYPVPQRQAARQHDPHGEPRVNMTLIRIWVLLFGFVGTQLAWTLRPFVGSPDQGFQILRSIEGNFYVNIVQTLGQLF